MADLMVDIPRRDGGGASELPKNGGKGRLKGVFSTTLKGVVGFGHTKKRTSQAVHVYVEELEDGRFSVQPLNSNFIPSGAIQCLSREELLNSYIPEPALYTEQVAPALNSLAGTIARGEQHYQKGETFSAEFEFKNALRVDEENIRATFGLGLTYLERGDRDKGALVFKRLAKLNHPFQEQHKHLFNEFGIQLRKNKLYLQALKHYARAYKLCKTDEHLLYNIARTLYEKGSLRGCVHFCRKAIALKRNFVEARDLLEIAKRRRYREREIQIDF
ncbi:tetratricopeptide repeat protein [Megalodesulfovibrio gigas]|uniref:tetratricopeptide repeat protein n=1 Tax=Megalodesulfovibrio gigas TaxID=879 RepID=UPI000401E571|nr:Tfp pilus assembly protein PilF [Megalodesulfovibrio gigas]